MPSGLLVVHLCYPDKLHLPLPSIYTLTVKDQRAAVRISGEYRTLQLIDLINPLVPSEEDPGIFVLSQDISAKYQNDNGFVLTSQQGDAVINIHKVTFDNRLDGSYRTFQTRYATDMIISYEVKDVNGTNRQDRGFYAFVTDEFVHIYRTITGDPRPRLLNDCQEPVRLDYVTCPYDDQDEDKSLDERLERGRGPIEKWSRVEYRVQSDDQPFAGFKIQEAHQKMEAFLKVHQHISLAAEFLSNAIHMASQLKNPTHAVLEAFISVELLVGRYLWQEKLRRGVSAGKLKDYESDVGISYMLNVELPMLINDLGQQGRQIPGDVDRVRKMRNDIVHEGKRVTAGDAQVAIGAAKRLHDMMEKWRLRDDPPG